MVTNDGATILKSVYVDNPAAKVLVGANTQFPETSEIQAPHILRSFTNCCMIRVFPVLLAWFGEIQK